MTTLRNAPLTHLGDISIETFFAEYWQKKPLFVRNAFQNFQPHIDAHELAGMSLESEVTSRLVIENRNSGDWQVEHGPFQEARFSSLPEKHWSLLVQHVDSIDEDVNEFLNCFRFLPNWRLEDIMVSYATDGGGVGPHFDYYDVFLIQASGQRRWKVGQPCTSQSPLVPNQPMKLLESFEAQVEYVVKPGDLLYIPAQLAHWGEAIGECMTYSVGFRAPSQSDVLLGYSEALIGECSDDQRYRDPELNAVSQASNPSANHHVGLIPASSVRKIRESLLAKIDNEESLANWLAEYASTPARDNFIDQEVFHETFDVVGDNAISPDTAIKLTGFVRAVYVHTTTAARLFINGQRFECSVKLAQTLSAYQCFAINDFLDSDLKSGEVNADELSRGDIEVLQTLANGGVLEVVE